MNLTVIQECPQCGGTCELSEASRLLVCPFCGVRLILANKMPHYLLPCKKEGEQLIWVPYLRLKGALFTCQNSGITHRLVDTTLAGVKLNILPQSLGFRPQALKLRQATAQQSGLFLENQLSTTQALEQASKRQQDAIGQRGILHQEWIGETTSQLYLPLVRDNDTLYDGVTGDPLARMPADDDFFNSHAQHSKNFDAHLLSSLCPNCGWDLDCHEQSVILFCHNCGTAWQLAQNGLQQIEYITRHGKAADTIHLPFWRLEVKIEGAKLASFADFLRLANIPKVIKAEWENRKMAFYCPAFRMNSKIFLRVASQITMAQLDGEPTDSVPNTLYPATLPASEAAESIKLTLASSAVAKRNILPLLPGITIQAQQSTLILLPFFDNGYELCQEEKKITINKQVLDLGKKL